MIKSTNKDTFQRIVRSEQMLKVFLIDRNDEHCRLVHCIHFSDEHTWVQNLSGKNGQFPRMTIVCKKFSPLKISTKTKDDTNALEFIHIYANKSAPARKT